MAVDAKTHRPPSRSRSKSRAPTSCSKTAQSQIKMIRPFHALARSSSSPLFCLTSQRPNLRAVESWNWRDKNRGWSPLQERHVSDQKRWLGMAQLLRLAEALELLVSTIKLELKRTSSPAKLLLSQHAPDMPYIRSHLYSWISATRHDCVATLEGGELLERIGTSHSTPPFSDISSPKLRMCMVQNLMM